MKRWLRLISCGILASSGFAEGTPPVAGEEPPPAPPPNVSPQLARNFTEVMPKFEPKAPVAADVPEQKPADISRASIIRLPQYIVREKEIPSAESVMTQSVREKIAMQKYLGDETGLTRALNMISIAGLWAKIPFLGKYPFIVGQFHGTASGGAAGPRTNEQRALDMYNKDKFEEEWDNLTSLEAPLPSPAK